MRGKWRRERGKLGKEGKVEERDREGKGPQGDTKKGIEIEGQKRNVEELRRAGMKKKKSRDREFKMNLKITTENHGGCGAHHPEERRVHGTLLARHLGCVTV